MALQLTRVWFPYRDSVSAYTSFLFSRPSWWDGVARLLDFGGRLHSYNDVPDDDVNDALAIRADWLAVLDDYVTSTHRVQQQGLLSQ